MGAPAKPALAYDIHSARLPSPEETANLLRTGLEAILADRLWVNPDCGLKTRGWPQTRACLENLVSAAPHRPQGAPWFLSPSFRARTHRL